MTELHFPQEWYESPDRPLSFIQQLEVRKLPGSTDGEFFFAALPHGDGDYIHEYNPDIPKSKYSENFFAVNFSPTPRARAATVQEWESASRIVTKSRYASSGGDDFGDIDYRGKKFQRAGKYSGGGLVSPGGRWLAIFSYTGEKKRDLFMDGGSVHKGDVFWQIYDTVTGEKVFEWQARNVKGPGELSGPVVWLEERYFLFPKDIHAQDFNVVTLPRFIPEKNVVTFQLPSRKNVNGERVPAPVNNEVWTPLVPLTKEQAEEITAPQPITLLGVRSPRTSSRMVFFAIREEIENQRRHRAGRGREEGGDYNYRLFSTYYYAISLDDPAQTRFATKEEWESASAPMTSRQPISLDKLIPTTGGMRREYRPFPKTGALGGSALVSLGDWTAVFSYTPDADRGRMFIDIFETRPGNKFSTTEFPYTDSPVPLFESAFWVGRHHLLLPLNTSFDSFALWTLP